MKRLCRGLFCSCHPIKTIRWLEEGHGGSYLAHLNRARGEERGARSTEAADEEEARVPLCWEEARIRAAEEEQEEGKEKAEFIWLGSDSSQTLGFSTHKQRMVPDCNFLCSLLYFTTCQNR